MKKSLAIPVFAAGLIIFNILLQAACASESYPEISGNSKDSSKNTSFVNIKKSFEEYTFGRSFKKPESQNKIVIAVLDTGIAVENLSRLKNIDFIKGYNFCGSGEKAFDDNGHGTFLTSWIVDTINSLRKNINYSIMPLKILDCNKKGNSIHISWGIRYAVANGAKIINISCGSKNPSAEMEEAVKYAYENSVIIVASSGNYGEKKLLYPAAYDRYVISVGSVGSNGKKADYSNYGENLFITAPGGDIENPVFSLGFKKEAPQDFCTVGKEGTSVSAAYVTALTAYLVSEKFDTPDKIKEMLIKGAIDKGPAGKDQYYGWGFVTPRKLVEAVNKENLKSKN